MTHPAFHSDSVAVVTGGASGIGLASATNFAGMGMRLVVVDRAEDKLAEAESTLRSAGAADVMTAATDISDRAEVEALEAEVANRFGGTDILMNNAGIGMRSSCLGPLEAWQSTLDVNLWGAVHGTQVFAPRMIARGRPGAIVNTGSKQGITTPPGNPAYNVSKAALKAFTEALAHELRNTEDCRISAHPPDPRLRPYRHDRACREATGRLDRRGRPPISSSRAWAEAISTSFAPTTTFPARSMKNASPGPWAT